MDSARIDTARWDLAKDLFIRAVEMPPEQQFSFVESVANDDAALKAELLQLLASFQPAQRFFASFSAQIGALGTSPETLTPGDMLAGRFRINRFLARGGMGEVYAATDLELGVEVALKLLQPALAARRGMLDQFRSEIRLARTVSSPHVCRVYDVARHHSSDGKELTFFTMELLDGCTLTHAITQKGRFRTPDAAPLIRQMAEGLAAAHQRGILHRDFKSGNVIVCDLDAQGPRAIITDFGLARLLAQDGATGAYEGATPAYVAPEQLERGEQSVATDVYSFGVVIYEMLTGAFPFTGETPLEMARKRLSEAPTPPRTHQPDLDSRWEAVILRCLERDPAKRYSSPLEVARALGCYASERPFGRRKFWLALAAAVPLGAVALWTWESSRTPAMQPSVAILPFDSGDANLAYIAEGIADRLNDSLTAVPGLKVVSRTATQRFQDPVRHLSSMAQQLHVRYAITGTVTNANRRLHVTTDIVEASSGFQIWSGTEDIEVQDVEAITARVSRAVIHSLHIDMQPAQLSGLDRRLTQLPEAYQLYLLGRYHAARRSRDSLRESVTVLERAVRLDPKFAEAWAALGFSYYDLSIRSGAAWPDQLVRSLDSARAALALNPNLAEAYLVIACDKHMWEWDWPGAEENFRRALSLNNSLAEAHRSFANLLSRLARHQEALQEVDQALTFDPLNSSMQVSRATILLDAGRVNEALDQYQGVLRTDPGYENVYIPMSDALERKGLLQQAIDACEKGAAITNRESYAIASLARLYALSGRTDLANQILSELERRYQAGEASPSEIADVYLGLGDKDKAFEWIERGIPLRNSNLTMLKVAPEYELLRSDPRYTALIARLRL